MIPFGWTAPEFKSDSYVISDSGKITLIDASMPSRVGKNLLRWATEILDGKRPDERRELPFIAGIVRSEIISAHNSRGTLTLAEATPFLARMKEV